MRKINFTVLCLFAIAAFNKVRTLRMESYVAMSPLPTTADLCGYLRGDLHGDDDNPAVEVCSNNIKRHWKLPVGLGVGLGIPLIGALSYIVVKRHRK